MGQARVVIINEVKQIQTNGWALCLQWARYEYDDNTEEMGYRFIWRKPDGTLQAARGQARIPSITNILELIKMAIHEGFGHYLEQKQIQVEKDVQVENEEE